MWFQNRRAKTKTQARKAEQAKALTTEGAGKNDGSDDHKKKANGKSANGSEGSASAPIDLTDKKKHHGEKSHKKKKSQSLGNDEEDEDEDVEGTPPPASPSPSISLVVDDASPAERLDGELSPERADGGAGRV